MARQWNGVYFQSLSAVALARYESKVLQAGLGIYPYSIDDLTPAALYFTRNCFWLMLSRKEPWHIVGKNFTCLIASNTRQRNKFYNFYSIDMLYALPPIL